LQLSPMHLKVSALLGGRLFRIPEYQRAYAWGARQRTDLFKDILDVQRTKREHFMATVVALARDSRLIGADEYRTVELVDGQQRITTIIILLKATEKALKYSEAVEGKIKRELNELLVKEDDYQLILLQTNHDSSNIFANYVRTGVVDAKEAVTAADINLVNAAYECENFVSNWIKDKSLVELVSIVRNRLSMIYHELNEEATVYRVFEVLNSRGLDVKWIDKLKSQLMALIFEHIKNGARIEAAKEMQVIWQDIYRALGLRGDLGDEALRLAGTLARKQRPSRIISQEDAAGELVETAGTQHKSIMAIGADLKKVVDAVQGLDSNVRLSAVTRIAHARFVAIAIILRNFPNETETDLLGKWERVTFRVFGLGGADTRNKVGEYVRLGYNIFTGRLPPAAISAGLADLGKGYSLNEVYTGLEFWGQCYDGWSAELRYLLFRYDESLSKASGERMNVSQWNKIWADDPAKSIEHIQPQSSGVSYVNFLGNLTMLPPSVNSSLQDKAPAIKAATYRSCGLKATMAVGEIILGGVVWDEKAVMARTAEMDAFVRSEWAD